VKLTVRWAGVIAGGALWVLLGLARGASADVVDPESAQQPVSAALMASPAPGSASEPAPVIPKANAAGAALAEGAPVAAPAASPAPAVSTPAPEQAVTEAPAFIRPSAVQVAAGVAVEGLRTSWEGIRHGFDDAGEFLGRAASACRVGVSTGVGGPILVLAVLGLVTALERRRVLGTRSAADEDAPEFLYARAVIAPG
jgi:hypothetical protein